MREVMYYECEFCGERFDDELDCLRHELSHQAEGIDPTSVLMWDRVGNRIDFEDFVADPQHWGDEVWAIETDSEEVRSYLRSIFYNYECGDCPYAIWGKMMDENGLVYYDDDCGNWESYNRKLDELNAIRQKFAVDA